MVNKMYMYIPCVNVCHVFNKIHVLDPCYCAMQAVTWARTGWREKKYSNMCGCFIFSSFSNRGNCSGIVFHTSLPVWFFYRERSSALQIFSLHYWRKPLFYAKSGDNFFREEKCRRKWVRGWSSNPATDLSWFSILFVGSSPCWDVCIRSFKYKIKEND